MESPLFLVTMKIFFLSCIAVGGFITTVPELQRYVVDIHNWMSTDTFVTLFGLAQAAPGPNFLVVSLVGWEVGGWVGAISATVAACIPTIIIAYSASRVWARHNSAGWYKLIERATTPVAVGLILGTGILLTIGASRGEWKGVAVTVATAAFLLASRRSPLIPLAVASLLGVTGLV
ncbi:chromate transporter [Paracoccus sp. (in: a-proteobacteria)]|uniref:chromate transporter n=1 Tax=Paracoccus sp. TaxID=267 RepID=UPI002AFF0142|nr:chromate transporter [Paracoccus sp. (in: a-proteobacteria)]